jgi:hypothetical protein
MLAERIEGWISWLAEISMKKSCQRPAHKRQQLFF